MAINSTYYLDAADLSTATAVYLDSLLQLIAPDGYYSDGTIVRQQSLGILLEEENCAACGELVEAYISDGFEGDDICGEDTLNPIYIYGNDGCVIETGNIACNTNDITDTFDGGNLYYTMYVAICDSLTYTYIVQINSVGYITVIDICIPPP